MKKNILSWALLATTTISFAQMNIPSQVLEAFNKDHKNISNVKWDKEKSNYEASFKINGVDNSMLFDSKGTILEKEVAISKELLPKGILSYVSKKYNAEKIKGAAKINSTKEGLIYEVEIKGKDILFDKDGKFIREAKD